jgi:hypothetical protein
MGANNKFSIGDAKDDVFTRHASRWRKEVIMNCFPGLKTTRIPDSKKQTKEIVKQLFFYATEDSLRQLRVE